MTARSRKAWLVALSCALAGALAASCSSSETGGTAGSDSAQSVHEQIVKSGCALSSSCHDSNGHKARLDLSSVDAMCAALKDAPSCERPSMKRAVPGQPRESWLLLKLGCSGIDCTSTLGAPDPSCTDAVSNARMPLNGPPLSTDKLQAIERWISGGMHGCP